MLLGCYSHYKKTIKSRFAKIYIDNVCILLFEKKKKEKEKKKKTIISEYKKKLAVKDNKPACGVSGNRCC